MSEVKLKSLQHRPEVVFKFVKRLIEDHRTSFETERRNSSREAISLPILVQPLSASFQSAGPDFHAVTKDISPGGIGILHDEPVEAKYLQIEICARDGETMSLLVHVEHVTPRGQLYHVGARFVVDWSMWRESESRTGFTSGSAGGCTANGNPAGSRAKQEG